MKRVIINKKNKILIIIIALLLIILTIAIKEISSITSEDNRFIRAAERGISEGLQEKGSEIELLDAKGNHNTAFISKELDAVKDFQKDDFSDQELGTIADAYISALIDCEKVVKESKPDNYPAFWTQFSNPYGRRIGAIYDLYKKGYIRLSMDKNKEELEDLLVQGWMIKKTEEISFERGKTEGDVSELVATITNDSGSNLEYIDLSIDVLDGNGKTIETVSAYADNIKAKEKAKLVCYVSNGKKAQSVEIKSVKCKRG